MPSTLNREQPNLRTIDGVSTADVFRNAVGTEWDGVPVRVIGFDEDHAVVGLGDEMHMVALHGVVHHA